VYTLIQYMPETNRLSARYPHEKQEKDSKDVNASLYLCSKKFNMIVSNQVNYTNNVSGFKRRLKVVGKLVAVLADE